MLKDIWTLLKIIFFVGSTLLSKGYIDIGKNSPFIYEKKLSIITPNAHVKIDISKSSIKELLDIKFITDPGSDKKLKNFLKKCPIKIYGIYKNKKIFFQSPYISWASNSDIFLNFGSNYLENIPYLEKLYIESSCVLDNVKIYWVNGGM